MLIRLTTLSDKKPIWIRPDLVFDVGPNPNNNLGSFIKLAVQAAPGQFVAYAVLDGIDDVGKMINDSLMASK